MIAWMAKFGTKRTKVRFKVLRLIDKIIKVINHTSIKTLSAVRLISNYDNLLS